VNVALAVGGLDPCGGAGILADARAMRAAGAWPCTVNAVSTVQTPRGVRQARAVDASWVGAQIEALAEDTRIRALKTGALGESVDVVRLAASTHHIPFLVVDPVARPSRGGVLLTDTGAMKSLLAAATLITPNIPEAEALLGEAIHSVDDARDAAVALRQLGCGAVLLKGGHASGKRVVDWLADASGVHRIARARLAIGEVHGTGCTLASLIAGRLACRSTRAKLSHAELVDVVRWGTRALNRWLRRAQRIGPGMRLLVG
jgi:hydroxymethylpyrimidine/phosphomethylpyrimidine kinase